MTGGDDRRIRICSGTILAAGPIYILSHLAAMSAPSWFWGVGQAAVLPTGVALTLSLAALALCALWVWPPTARVLCGWMAGCSPVSAFGAGVMLVLTLILFVALPVSHGLLGDGALLMHMITEAPGPTAGRLDSYSLSLFHQALSALWQNDAAVTFRVLGALAGLWALIWTLVLSARLSRHALVQCYVLACLALTGTTLLYFGYPEVYAPLAALLTTFAVSLILWDGDHLRWLSVAAASGLMAVCYHPLGVITLPAILASLFCQFSRVGSQPLPRRFWLGAAVLTVAGGVLVYQYAFLFVLGSTTPGYGFFHPSHGLDLVNIFLLGAPVQAWICLVLIVRGPWPLRRHPVTICLCVLVASATVVAAFIEPLLGALDWDLWTLGSIPVGALAAWLGAHTLSRQSVGPVLGTFATAGLLHLGLWVWANSEPQRATQLVEIMVAHDAHHRGERNAILAAKMRRLGQTDAAVRQYEAALKFDPGNPLALHQYGLFLYTSGEVERGVPLLKRFVASAPVSLDTRIFQCLVSFHEGDEGQGALLCGTFMLDHEPDEFTRLSILKLEQSCKTQQARMILQTARRYSDGDDDAIVAWERFTASAESSPVTRRFSRDLHQAVGKR